MELAALCTDAGVASRVTGATAGVDVLDISYRSERSGPGSLFCCLVGGSADGLFPSSALTQASDGNLYGTTRFGGAFNGGTVYKMTPDGTVTAIQPVRASVQCCDDAA